MANPTYTVTPISNRPSFGSVSAPVTDNAGVVALLTATPNEGYTFLCWSDGAIENPHRYTIPEKNITVKAYFYQTNPFKYLLDLSGLGRFWDKIKTWYAEKTTKLISGAKQIGFCNSDTTYIAEDVQDALEEVKIQSDDNTSQISYVKTNYVKRDPTDIAQNPVVLTGSYEFSSVPANADYSVINSYFSAQDSSSLLYFSPVNCANENYNSNITYYYFDPANADYYNANISGTIDFGLHKNDLYYLKANNMTFDEWKASGSFYTGVGAAGQRTDWRSLDTWAAGMPHSGVIAVTTGFNSGFQIIDDTIGKTLILVNGKGKYGAGCEALSTMFCKGHHIRVHCFHAVDGGDGTWSQICLSFFGD